MNKRGYFFIVDALIGATILFVTIMILVNSGTSEDTTVQPFTTLNTYVQLLYATELRDLNTDFVSEYITDGNISDNKNTIVEQLTVWHYLNSTGCTDCLNYSKNIVEELSGTIEPTYGISVLLNGTLLYNRSVDLRNESSIHLTTSRVSIAIINETAFYGPLIFEVSLWV